MLGRDLESDSVLSTVSSNQMKSLKSSVHNNVHAVSPRPNSAPIQIQNILHTTNMPGPLLVKTGAL